MDPWLEWQLRLADRRGLLQGRSLSAPAVLGCQLLYFMDMKEKAEDFWNSLRASLVAGSDDPDRIRAVFPELFPIPVSEWTEDLSFDDIDLSSIEWGVPSADEFQRVQQQIEENQQGLLDLSTNTVGIKPGEWV